MERSGRSAAGGGGSNRALREPRGAAARDGEGEQAASLPGAPWVCGQCREPRAAWGEGKGSVRPAVVGQCAPRDSGALQKARHGPAAARRTAGIRATGVSTPPPRRPGTTRRCHDVNVWVRGSPFLVL